MTIVKLDINITFINLKVGISLKKKKVNNNGLRCRNNKS